MRQHGMKDARRRRAAGVLVVLAGVMGAATAWGCPPRPPLLAKVFATEWKRSAAIVEVVAGSVETHASDGAAGGREERQHVRWSVSRAWKAPAGTSLELLTDTVVSGTEGGARFEPGDHVVLFLAGSPPWQVGHCAMILPVDQSAKDLRYLHRQAARVAQSR
jgi:hypothetical protein